MRIIGFNKGISILATSLVAVAASAQQGIGTDTPHKSSVLELQSSKRGLLIPRIRLTATNEQAPVNAPENSLLVYNTNTTTGVNKVEPGYYYWSQADNSWMRIINQKDVDTAIANVADTKVTGATLSGTTLTIKQSGSTPDITVNLATLDTNTTYTGDNSSIKIEGTTVKRAALTGDVEAAEGSGVTKVTKLRGRNISTTPPTSGQVLQWDGYNWKPVNMPLTYVGDDTSIKVSGANIKRAALTGDVEAAEGSSVTKVTKIQGQKISAAAPTTDGQVLKWDGDKWAPAEDALSKETVKGEGIIKVEGSGSVGDNNRSFTVSIESAGPSGTKVLQSVDGTVKWADAPSTGGGNLQTMVTKVKTTASGPLAGTSWGANAEDPDGVYLVVLTYGFVGVVNLPDPANFKNRSIALQNISGSSRSFGSNPPANIGGIGSNRAMQLVSDGTSWYVAGGL